MTSEVESAIKVGRVEFSPTYRLRVHSDYQLAKAFNANHDALRQLQATVIELVLRIDELEKQLKEAKIP